MILLQLGTALVNPDQIVSVTKDWHGATVTLTAGPSLILEHWSQQDVWDAIRTAQEEQK